MVNDDAETLGFEVRRGLMGVVLDLAEDLGVRCAVAVLDADGSLVAAECEPRPPRASLSEAISCARRALIVRAASRSVLAAGLPLAESRGGGHLIGAIGVWGDPQGFAQEAAEAAARALRLDGSSVGVAAPGA